MKNEPFEQGINLVQEKIQETLARLPDDKDNSLPAIDKLNLYFGEDYRVCDGVVIKQPKIQDFITYGEKNIYGVIIPFVTNPTAMKVQLWDMGIDWTKIEDYTLFLMLFGHLDPTYTSVIFGDLDFRKFNMEVEEIDGESKFYMYNSEQNVRIDENIYKIISNYLRTMFSIFPKTEKIRGKSNKRDTVEQERQKSMMEKDENDKSNLLPMISFCLNHPGFKYKKNELREVGLVEFMDSVKRLQVYEVTNALLKGKYSGFIDTSKIKDQNAFNFMQDI